MTPNLDITTIPSWPCTLIRADYDNPPQVLGNGVTADLTFADPPYNLGVKYHGDPAKDKRTKEEYQAFTRRSIRLLQNSTRIGGTFFWMTTEEHADWTGQMLDEMVGPRLARIVWYEAFAQYQGARAMTKDFRFIFIHTVGQVENPIWNPDAIRIPSARQLIYKDKRAGGKKGPRGRVPGTTWDLNATEDILTGMAPKIVDRLKACEDDAERIDLIAQVIAAAQRLELVPGDVWKFRRLQGTSHDHVDWHPCQLPPELLERIVQGWSNPGSVVLDGFAGSGSLAKVCKRLGRQFVGVDRSMEYHDRMFKELA